MERMFRKEPRWVKIMDLIIGIGGVICVLIAIIFPSLWGLGLVGLGSFIYLILRASIPNWQKEDREQEELENLRRIRENGLEESYRRFYGGKKI